MLDRFTDRARKVMSMAKQEALDLHSNKVGTEHLLLALAKEDEGIAAEALRSLDISYDDIMDTLKEVQTTVPEPSEETEAAKLAFTPLVISVMERSFRVARENNQTYVSTEHLLIGIVEEGNGMAMDILMRLGVSSASIKKAIEKLTAKDQDKKRPLAGAGAGRPGAGLPFFSGSDASQQKGSGTDTLKQFATNLTQKARDGELDPVIGREKEVQRMMEILSRRTKNNPLILGDPGVGKTAIAEGLAMKIAKGDVPYKLQDKEVYLLDLTALVAGTQFRGQFESRMKGLIDEVKKIGNIILVIDEVHNIVGAGDSEGSMNAANILKPALARGDIQVIGATTLDEYRKNIEKDAALERRFQPVHVGEPTEEEAVQILEGLKDRYEAHHKVQITDEAIESAVKLSSRYIADRYLPDKAIDLLDEACACAALRNKKLADYEEANLKLEKQRKAEAEIEGAENVDYEALAEAKYKVAALEKELAAFDPNEVTAPVTEADLAYVIELWTGIPAAKIEQSELGKLAHLEEKLSEHIVGQEEAVKAVSAAIRRSRVQINPRRRPASFIFVGPTGTGKTELVRVLSKELFDSPETLIRLDMSEFMEKHSVSKIIGSPPGYVGYDEAGQLTEKVRRRPYSVLLFDEIEKAHPDVMNILLQILDEGRITDAHGRTVNFENTVIVMTSNAGSNSREALVGFNRTSADISREKAMRALSDFLRPEFLSRIDEIVVFRPLNEEDYKKIAVLMLNEYVGTLNERGITLRWTDEAVANIAHRAAGGKSGARDIRNTIRRTVEDKIASLIVEKGEGNVTGILVTEKDGEIDVESI